MTSFDHHTETMSYKLLLVDPHKRLILVERRGSTLELPEVHIPQYKRAARELNEAVLEKWSLHSLVIDWMPSWDENQQCAVFEIDSTDHVGLPEGFSLIPIVDLPIATLPPAPRSALEGMLEGDTADRGPFSRFGWIGEAKQWIQTNVGSRVEFTDVRQLNAGGTFVLVRFAAANNQAYWLKAVGEPNAHEFHTTSYLAGNCSQYLPRIVAMREDWNSWVMEDVGSSLYSSDSLADFEHAVVRLASLQKRLVGKSDELFAAQFGDHRLSTLDSHIDELMDFLQEAMPRQKSTKVRVVLAHRLREIGALLHDVCYTVDAIGIPDSVIHCDISPGSILTDGSTCVFTDWCEAFVGNPFISLEQLCMHAARRTSTPEVWISRLKSVYRSSWESVLSDRQIETAQQLIPLISVFSYLYGRGNWLHTARRLEPAFQGYARSLARHMDVVATGINLSEGSWTSR